MPASGLIYPACVTISWTATGDDGNVGTATYYDIRYSTSFISESNWYSATKVAIVPTPAQAGTPEQFEVCGLDFGTTYTLAIKVADEMYNWSPLSNVVIKATPLILQGVGDLNLNGIPFEVADIVVFTNYFTFGFGALNIDPANQISQTDIDQNGVFLTVSDLAYMVRVVVDGDLPNSKVAPVFLHMDLSTTQQEGQSTVVADASGSIAVAHFVYDVEPGLYDVIPSLAPEIKNMTLKYHVDNDKLRVLVFNLGSEKIEAGSGPIIQVSYAGEGRLQLAEAQFADYYGRLYKSVDMPVEVPSGYTLDQNYPNPFNPTTNIRFTLSAAADVRLDIYNTLGQHVKTIVNNTIEAGEHTVVWNGESSDGTRVASGIYLYRLQADDYTETRKMILLK
jgi:hypothetical protein